MDAAVIAERQEADGIAQPAQGDLPGFSFPAGGEGDREDQPDPAWLGEVLRDRPLQPVFLVHPKLGRDEDSASLGSGVPTSRLRLEAMEPGMAVPHVGTLFGVPRIVRAVVLSKRSKWIGLINLDAKCAGARSAGNPHATCDVAGAGNGATAIPNRARRGKPRIHAKEEPTGHRASARPYQRRSPVELPHDRASRPRRILRSY